MNIGIDIGGSHIAVGLVDYKDKIIIKKEHNWADEEKIDLLESIKQYSKKFIKEIIQGNNNIDKRN